MKKILLSLFCVLYLACGVALAAPIPADSIATLKCYTDQHFSAAVPRGTVEALQMRTLESSQSPVLRSDMRIASAGMVFNRAVDQIIAESTAPS